jgi:hypothetical protein
MKIKCSKCKYIFEIERGYDDESENIVYCPGCNEEINILSVNEYNEDDDIKYIDTKDWKNNKIVMKSVKSGRVLFSSIICIVFSLMGIIHAFSNKLFYPNGILLLIILIFGCYLFLMFAYGKIIFSIGNNSYVFIGVGKIGYKRKIDWNYIKKIYMGKSLFKRGRKYYLILRTERNKTKINITLLNEKDRDYLVKQLQNLRYRKINN